jgi:hypothetical protein
MFWKSTIFLFCLSFLGCTLRPGHSVSYNGDSNSCSERFLSELRQIDSNMIESMTHEALNNTSQLIDDFEEMHKGARCSREFTGSSGSYTVTIQANEEISKWRGAIDALKPSLR